eukprot:4163633-Pleurochrysis_carterae.AAC.2
MEYEARDLDMIIKIKSSLAANGWAQLLRRRRRQGGLRRPLDQAGDSTEAMTATVRAPGKPPRRAAAAPRYARRMSITVRIRGAPRNPELALSIFRSSAAMIISSDI